MSCILNKVNKNIKLEKVFIWFSEKESYKKILKILYYSIPGLVRLQTKLRGSWLLICLCPTSSCVWWPCLSTWSSWSTTTGLWGWSRCSYYLIKKVLQQHLSLKSCIQTIIFSVFRLPNLSFQPVHLCDFLLLLSGSYCCWQIFSDHQKQVILFVN